MGDRANVHVAGVYLYTHWGGSELPETVRRALIRGEERWQDEPYLARIIFCEMVGENVKGTTGYGISAECGDGDDRVVIVDASMQRIRFGRGGPAMDNRPRPWPVDWVPFSEYVNAPRGWPSREERGLDT